jgi:hypothetical protein
VNLTAPVQPAAFVSTRTKLLDGSLRAWKHPVLIEDLRRVRARTGSEAIELPRYAGDHRDVASAFALAVFEHRNVTDAPPPEFRQPIPVDLADNHVVAGLDGRPAQQRRAGW